MMRRNGFTLLEMLVVMGIMVLVMGICAMGFQGIRRGAEVRAGALTIRTTLMLARQQAVTKRHAIRVVFNQPVNSPGYITVSVDGGQTIRTLYLTPGVTMTFPVAGGNTLPIVFAPSGGTTGGGGPPDKIKIEEVPAKGYPPKTVSVWRLTGSTKEEG